MKSIYSLDLCDLEEYLKSINQKPYRAKQIFKWLYEKRVESFENMTDLSKDLIETFKKDFSIGLPIINKQQNSIDGTIKYLFQLEDGSLIETVLMFFEYGSSVCVTSQVGCNMGCTFCASGLLKKQRDLTPGEIVQQVLVVQKHLDETNERLGNIVVMGTGEPFDNYDNVLKAMSIVNNPFGLQLGSRHISISTCGLVPKIKQFSKEHMQYNLAISLHAANNELRSKLMPINRAYPLEELMNAIKEYCDENTRRVTFEYLLLNGVNDTQKDADDLKKLLKGLNAYLNLIPYNEVKENEYKSSSDENALRFYDMLKKNGLSVTLRQKRGTDIDAACGQLRAKETKKNEVL